MDGARNPARPAVGRDRPPPRTPSLIGRLNRLSVATMMGLLFLSALGIGIITYDVTKDTLPRKAAYLQSLLTESLRIPLWDTTDHVVAAIASAVSADRDLSELRIRDEAGREIFSYVSRDLPGAFFIRRVFTVDYRERSIGTVSMLVNGSVYLKKLFQLVGLAMALLIGTSLLNLLLLRRAIKRSFGRALQDLDAVSLEYARGDYSTDLGTLAAYGEFSGIASTMGVMVGTIREQLEKVQDLRNHLEEKVAIRTAELEERNRELDAERARAEGLVASLTEAARAKDDFLATMSHELRTPLNAIIGFSRLMGSDAALGADKRRDLAIIRDAGVHLLSIINDILDTSKITARTLELQEVAFPLGELPGFIRSLIGPKAAEKDLELGVRVDGELPEAVVGDERRVRQVILNLANNAVKYTREGRIDIRFSWDGAGEFLTVAVTDTGVGIPADRQERIFRPFERIRAEGEFIEGTGLGLSISRNLAECMGGGIDLRSEPGRGSTFTARFHLAVAAGGARTSVADDRIVGYEGERRRVLLVDDIPDNTALLVAMLEPLGFTCLSAADGMEALSLMESPPDLVVTDFLMPRMDGVELARAIRERFGDRAPPIIGVSASLSEGDQRFLRSTDRFLRKPLDSGALLAAIGELLGLRWIHADSAEGRPEPSDLGTPPAHLTAPLAEAARRGDYSAIEAMTESLSASGYARFADRLRRLAERYDEAGIIALVKEDS